MSLSSYRLNVQAAVTDMARAEEFYEGKLGLSAVSAGADGSKVYASGGDASLVAYPSPDHAVGSTATLATWYVDDVEQAVDELTSKGVTFEQYEGVLESGFDYRTDERGVSPRASGSAKWPGSKIPTATSFRSRVIAELTRTHLARYARWSGVGPLRSPWWLSSPRLPRSPRPPLRWTVLSHGFG
jgi:hypothetical protein